MADRAIFQIMALILKAAKPEKSIIYVECKLKEWRGILCII